MIMPWLLCVAACHRTPPPVTPDDEALYYLVGEPCSIGDYNTAIARADSLLANVEMSDSVRAYIMLDRDVSILNLGHLEWGGAYADSVIDFGRRSGVELAVTQGLQNRGSSRRRLGDYDGSVADYSEALDLATASGDKEMEQALTECLGVMLAERRRFDEALDFSRRSLQLAIEADDSVAALNAVSTIGAILVLGERYGEVVGELTPYRGLASASPAPMRVKYLTPIINTYLALDSLESARRLIAEADSVASLLPEGHQSQFVVTNMKAQLAAREGRHAEQWKFLQEMDAFGTQGKMPWNIYSEKARCLASLGRYEEAYRWQLRAFDNRDSIAHAETDARITEMSVKYDTLQKEIEIERLKSERLGWTSMALAALIVLAGVVAAGVALRARERRKMERQKHGEFIRGVEEERRRVARELHDEIAGDLIGMQWMMESLSRDEASDMVSRIGMRVRKLSHELMPPQFESQTFSQLLLDYVAGFNSSHKDHRIVLSDEGSYPWNELHPEQSLELYRITQEAVNNAVRHGAPGDIGIMLSGDRKKFSLTVVNGLREGEPDLPEEARLESLRTRASILGATFGFTVESGRFILTVRE